MGNFLNQTNYVLLKPCYIYYALKLKATLEIDFNLTDMKNK